MHGVAWESPNPLGAREEVWETGEVQRHRGQGNCRNRSAASAAPAHTCAHVGVFVPLFAQNRPFILIKFIAHTRNKVVPQPVTAEKTYKPL